MRSPVCHLVGAGDFSPAAFKPQKDDLIIACDAGRAHLDALGVRPDLTVGDFDSFVGDARHVGEKIVLPTEKNDTDMEFAAKTGLERGYRSFLLHGSLGGARLSHTLGNMSLLLMLKNAGADALLVGENTEVGLLLEGESRVFSPAPGYVSFFAASDRCRLCLSGFKYPFDDFIDRSCTRTVSNEFLNDPACARTLRGSAFFIIERKCAE